MRILYVTTISLTMNSFFQPHIKMLINEGHQVDIACNHSELSLDEIYNELNCQIYQVDFSRSPLSRNNLKAYGQLKKIVKTGNYDIVHCHTPNASFITRLVCQKHRKKRGLKVFYTAHGFHFYKGAPKLKWIVFYPIEKFCSRFTDKLITINQEDFKLAKTKFHAKEVHYVLGVGIDVSRFRNIQVDRNVKRKEIGIPENAFLLLSVGELNENKNHQVVIKALAKLNNPNVHYAIAGDGDKKAFLLSLADEHEISNQVHLLGYRNDVAELYKVADIYVLPSIREGLNVSLMEAMASGLTCIASKIRGNIDLVYANSGLIFNAFDDDEISCIIKFLHANKSLKGETNVNIVEEFSVVKVVEHLNRIIISKG